MTNKNVKNSSIACRASWDNSNNRPGIILLVTLVLLVVLATLGYTLSSQVAAQRHRDQYIIDYSKARYGCESGVKYALATIEEIDPQLISRPNEPDFSDLFALTESQYQELLKQWGIEYQNIILNKDKNSAIITDTNDVNEISPAINLAEFDYIPIRGPYGPPWPFVTDPVEFEIGSVKVTIEIEDENAKYPLGWALLDDKETEREVEAGFYTFFEWMRLDAGQIDLLREELEQIGEIKPFKLDFKQITKTVRTPVTRTTNRRTSRTRRNSRTTVSRKVIPVSEQITEQTTHFAKLFHSSLLDTEALAKPILFGESRKESALKYLGIWGSQKVNINTAPRHVLEAAFIFGGDEVKIADEIILKRREKTFGNIEDLKKELIGYSDSIGKCEKYITTVSRFFTIKITATSGVAKASSIIAITKDGKKIQRIAVING
jgi:hypothetical protein